MREAIAGVMAAGAVLLPPQATEQPEITEAATRIETVDANSETPAPAQTALPEASESALVDDPARYDVDTALHKPNAFLPQTSERQNVALPPEMLDPNQLLFWIEIGIAGLGVTGGTSVFASRRLRKSLTGDHAAIQERGMDAQHELSIILKAAEQQANGLRDDDVPKLRKLIERHNATSTQLFDALAGTGTEFDAEYERFFPLKGRLHRAPNVATVLEATQTATKQAKELQTELDRVKTDLAEIDTNVGNAKAAAADVHNTLDALTEKGWDVSKYRVRATLLTTDAEVAEEKRAQNYVDVPTSIAKTVTEKAAKLKKKAAALEPRRVAADEVYSTQANRVTEAVAIGVATRDRVARLQGTYSEACLVDFENIGEKLTEMFATLTSAHQTGGTLVGDQGKSVEAVERSEELSEAFDKALEGIKMVDTALQAHEKHLAALVEALPDQIDKLNARFDRAMMMVDDPDIEDGAAANIRSLANGIAKLSKSISTEEGHKPDYLDIEKRHQKLAKQLAQAHNTATQQKQEMNDLRNEVPQLKNGYNDLVKVIQTFAKKARLSNETKSQIRRLQAYEYDVATDRKNLRKQRRNLEQHLRDAHDVLQQAETDAGEDSPLMKTAKIAGGVALAVIGIDLLD